MNQEKVLSNPVELSLYEKKKRMRVILDEYSKYWRFTLEERQKHAREIWGKKRYIRELRRDTEEAIQYLWKIGHDLTELSCPQIFRLVQTVPMKNGAENGASVYDWREE